MPTPDLTVIIPTRNASKEISLLLTALRNQETSTDLEILVIDSASTDDTVDQARQQDARVISIPAESFNHGGTRNYGAKLSRGEYLFFFTQDAFPLTPRYLQNMIHALEKHGAAAAFARQVPRSQAGPLVKRNLQRWQSGSSERKIQHIESLTAFFSLPPMERYLMSLFDNVASVIRRSAWESIPFPEAPFGEDIEWGFRALCNGYTLVYEPEAMVEHSHERSPGYLYQRTFVDHYRLYEIFGLRTIPTRRHTLRAFWKTTWSDWRFLAQEKPFTASWWKEMRDAPRNAWASAWGQYHGARSAARGIRIGQSREV